MKISLRGRHALVVADGASSHKIDYCYNFLENSKYQSASKLHHWFKSYGDFDKWVDFAYWWSFSGEGAASATCAAGLFFIESTIRKFTVLHPSESYCTNAQLTLYTI